MSLLINENFRSRSRHAKKITTGIYLIFRGLFFEHNAETCPPPADCAKRPLINRLIDKYQISIS